MQLEDIKSIFTRVLEKDPTVTWEEAMPILIGWIRTNGANTRGLSSGGHRWRSNLVFAEDTLMQLAKVLDKS